MNTVYEMLHAHDEWNRENSKRRSRTGGLRVAQQAVENISVLESEAGVDDVFYERRLPVRAKVMQRGS
jgi:hypothetical protein